MEPYHRRMGITDAVLARAGKVLEKALTGDRQLTRAELYHQFRLARIPTASPDGVLLGMHLLCHWAQAGLICIAARRGPQPTFALLEEWTPRGRTLSGDEALAELATTYFRAHGPATVRDFAWWAGFPLQDAQRALSLIADRLRAIVVDGPAYWLLRDTPDPPSGPLPTILLPPFDEYTVAYADRSAAADPSILSTIRHGLAPNLLINGRIAGTWKRTLLAGNTVALTPTLLRILNRKEQADLARAAERYAAFLGRTLASGEVRQRRTRTPVHKGITR